MLHLFQYVAERELVIKPNGVGRRRAQVEGLAWDRQMDAFRCKTERDWGEGEDIIPRDTRLWVGRM